MLLFFTILITMFIAEMGDKTQLLMIAMSSRFKLRDIILASALAILALNAIAVCLGAIISEVIPMWLIKLIAGLAFFYFAWSTMDNEDEEEEDSAKDGHHPILTIFATFFLAELGDKTQLTAIAFAANQGLNHAITVWLACSIGLFTADLVGMMLGYIIKSKMPEGFLDKLAFVVFAIFGFTTLSEGAQLVLGEGTLPWIIAAAAALVFVAVCLLTYKSRSSNNGNSEN